jgi:phosphate butyryltransferase
MIRNFNQLLEAASRRGNKTVAVACAQDPAAMEAAAEAARRGLARSILVGEKPKVQTLLKDRAAAAFEIIHEPDEHTAICRAVRLVREGNAELLLKGACKTSALLKAALDKQHGIGAGNLLSDVFLFEDTRRNKLVIISDGGVVLQPTLEQKIAIIKNAVAVARALGNSHPKVALLSAVETVIPELPASVDAAAIAQLNREGKIADCVIEGPLSLDLAVSAESARIKQFQTPVAGDADILIAPDIVAANLMAKGISHYGGVRVAHVIIGARAPILIPSRSDPADTKFLSIALGIVAGA